MPFHRTIAPSRPVDSDALTSCLVGIGMNFAASPASNPNIEDTILFASIEGMEKHDLRVLAVLVTWFGIHAPWVNADRLTNLVAGESSVRVRALWTALAGWQKKDRRFAHLSVLYAGARQDVVPAGTEFQISRHGEDERFQQSVIRVGANILRDRTADVVQPSALAHSHRPYHYRVMMGPNYRADMWAALEENPKLSAADLARKTYGSFATAWHALHDFRLLAHAPSRGSGARMYRARPQDLHKRDGC